MKPNLPFVIVLILLLQLGSSSSICGFQECTGCVIASHSVPYWRGGRVCSLLLSPYLPTIVRRHRLCRLFLLSDRFVFDGPKSIYGLQPHLPQLRYIYSVCAGREIGISLSHSINCFLIPFFLDTTSTWTGSIMAESMPRHSAGTTFIDTTA